MESRSPQADRYRRWGSITGWIFIFICLVSTAMKYLWSWDVPWWVELARNALIVPAFVFPILGRRAEIRAEQAEKRRA